MIWSMAGTASLSCTTSARVISPSAPSGSKIDVGCGASCRASVTRSQFRSHSSASSSIRGERPSSDSSWALARWTRLTVSPAWTGRRMVRLVLAMARVMAWRIHHVA